MINEVVDWIITIGFTGVAVIFGYTFRRINELWGKLNDHQQDTERRLGEFIRREELNGILDRVEERMEKQLAEMKDLIKEWISKHNK